MKEEDYKKLQSIWYEKLAKSGFQDIEDTDVRGFEDGRPLKKWEGISPWILGEADDFFNIIDIQSVNGPDFNTVSSWPEPIYCQEQELLNHPDFKVICERLFKHGNSACTSEQVIVIWRDYCEGDSQRTIGKRYGISDTTVLRITHRLTEWMHMADLSEQTKPADSKVIVRKYNPDQDAPFLFSSWRNSLWYDQERNEDQSQRFFYCITKEIKNILNTPETNVNVACLSDDPNFILGYSVCTGTNLVWCYVKIEYREKGIAKLLTKGFKTISEPMTRIGNSIASNHDLKLKEKKDERRKEESDHKPI